MFYFTLPWVYATYQIVGNVANHPDLCAEWMLPEPFKQFFDNQGRYRHDFYVEGHSYRLYDHAALYVLAAALLPHTPPHTTGRSV